MQKKFPTGKVIWLIIFFGIGFGFLATFSWTMHRNINHAEQSWAFLPTPATITQSSLQPRPDGERLALTYIYSINGVTYTGSRYKFGIEERDFGEFSRHPAARDIRSFHRQYPVGSHITIFVNPADPSDATVVRGHVYLWYEILFLSLITLTFGVGLCLTIVTPRWAAKNFESSDPS